MSGKETCKISRQSRCDVGCSEAPTSKWAPKEHHMGWLRLVGSLKLQVSLAKEPYKRDDILQKRPMILRSLLTRRTYRVCNLCIHVWIIICAFKCDFMSHVAGLMWGMYVCMQVCLYVCKFVCVNATYANVAAHTMHACECVFAHFGMFVFMYVCMYVCRHVCVYVGMSVCM